MWMRFLNALLSGIAICLATATASLAQVPPGWQAIGSGLFFDGLHEPPTDDWSSRRTATVFDCANLCPVYRSYHGCESFFYSPPGAGETEGHCELHNIDRSTGLNVIPDTGHHGLNFTYYEKIKKGAANPSNPNPPLDFCLYLGRQCGEPAASAWCARQGKGSAVTFTVKQGVPQTQTIGDGQICNAGPNLRCDTFSAITCSGNVPPPNPGPPPAQPASTLPCLMPAGPACFEMWINEFTTRANAYNATPEFNSRKPWSINKYGLIEGGTQAGPHSAFAPDDFPQNFYNRYCWMWSHAENFTGYPWGAAAVPLLRPYVSACIAQSQK